MTTEDNPLRAAKRLGQCARQVGLSLEEKLAGLHALQQLTNLQPLPRKPRVKRQYQRWFAWQSIASTLAMALLVATGTTLAAQQALPGDPLYPVKIYVNEPVATLLAHSPEAKAETTLRQAQARVWEAAQLSAQDKLSPQIEQELEARFQQRTEQAFTYVQKSTTFNPALSQALAAHEQILHALDTQPPNLLTTKPETVKATKAVAKKTPPAAPVSKRASTTPTPAVTPAVIPPQNFTIPPELIEQIKLQLENSAKNQSTSTPNTATSSPVAVTNSNSSVATTPANVVTKSPITTNTITTSATNKTSENTASVKTETKSINTGAVHIFNGR
jgi:hypothetical protein